MPMTVTSTSGSVVHIRPLPSDSTTQTVPVSAIPKLAPLTAMGVDRNFSRRCRRAASARAAGSSESVRPAAIVASKTRRISARLRWIAGTRMCDDQSPASWLMSSARSVSTAAIPSAARASLRPISSVAIDLTLMTSETPWSRAMPATIALASTASRAQCTSPPAWTTDSSSRSSSSGRVAIVRALIAAPAARRSSQSSTSPTAAARRARMVPVARARLTRSCPSPRAVRAAAGNPDALTRVRPGSRPGASSALRSAGAAGRRRCA